MGSGWKSASTHQKSGRHAAGGAKKRRRGFERVALRDDVDAGVRVP